MPQELRPFALFLGRIFASFGKRPEIIPKCQNSSAGFPAADGGISLARFGNSFGPKIIAKGGIAMARALKSRSIEIMAGQRAEDGIPESPEFSSVQRLMNEFQSHATHEQRWLSNYQDIAKETSEPLIRFLLGLIVADEEAHHELMGRMISKLKDELAWTRSTGPARRTGERGEMAKRLLVSVESFIEAERKAIREYERLKKESQGLYRDVFALLYTTMIHDSHKHLGILEFLRRKLTENPHSARKRKR
jgi:hypothetical protein